MTTQFKSIETYCRFINNFEGELSLRNMEAYHNGIRVAYLDAEYIPAKLKYKLKNQII